MRLMPPTQPRAPRPQRHDLHAMERKQVSDGAMTHQDLENLVRDCEWEPDWRREADLNAAYYDGYQKTDEQRRLEKEGQPVAVVNLIARTINVMLGQEAKARSSWKVSADTDEFGDVADACQVKLTEAQRETFADLAISEAYASQCKAGLGWVEVSRVADVFAPFPYRVKPVHRNELWWDWRAQELGLEDCRWMLRQRWLDMDEAEVMMPEWAELFRYYGDQAWNNFTFAAALHSTEVLRQADDLRRQFKVRMDEWLNTSRRRIKFYEVWYRVTVPTVALITADKVVEYRKADPMHAEVLRRGMGKLQKTWKRVMRMAMFIGPHRIMDVATNRKKFPYIPFWAFRDDENRAPYSPVSGMRYPQDEYNARRSRLMWLLQAAQVFVDDDALAGKYNNLIDLSREVMRPDAMVVLNHDRRRDQGIRIERNTQLPGDQVNVMTDAKQLIQEQPGISATMMGDAVPGVTSGLAFNSLVQQSAVAVGDLDDNYRYGRRGVGEGLLDLIVEDLARPNMQVRVGLGKGQRTVVLNTKDEHGMPANMVKAAPVKVALEEAPNTPAYRMQQQAMISNVLQVAGQDPAVRAVMVPALIESTDLPNREHDARWLREQNGIPQPGDKAGQEKAEAAKAQQAQQAAQLQATAAAAELASKQADALQKQTAAELNRARVAEIKHRIEQSANEDQLIGEAMAEANGS